jgi:hypothetical protein
VSFVKRIKTSFFPVVQQPKSSLDRLLLEVHAWHSDTPHSVALHRRDLYLTTHRHSQETNIHAPVTVEAPIPANARPKANALDCAAIGIGEWKHQRGINNSLVFIYHPCCAFIALYPVRFMKAERTACSYKRKINIVEIVYNVTKGTEYFMSL